MQDTLGNLTIQTLVVKNTSRNRTERMQAPDGSIVTLVFHTEKLSTRKRNEYLHFDELSLGGGWDCRLHRKLDDQDGEWVVVETYTFKTAQQIELEAERAEYDMRAQEYNSGVRRLMDKADRVAERLRYFAVEVERAKARFASKLQQEKLSEWDGLAKDIVSLTMSALSNLSLDGLISEENEMLAARARFLDHNTCKVSFPNVD